MVKTSASSDDMVKRKRGRPKKDPNAIKKTSKGIASVFIELCKKGMSLTQIADFLDIPKETLETWSRDKTKHSAFATAFKRGKTAWQAYHENLLQTMITGSSGIKYAAAEIAAQRFVLETQFKSEWQVKSEAKVEINHVGRLSDEQLEQQILNLLSKSQLNNYMVNEDSDTKPKLVVNNDSR